jgi:predicted lipoprotein with Yx(FWY)xxD motif
MKTLIVLISILALGILAPAAMSTQGAARGVLTTHPSSFGRILFDGRGFAVYAFTKDGRSRSSCSGACAAVWPPYIVAAAPRAAAGVKRSLLGTTRRADGRLQVTYRGRPLYYYVGDRSPGQILCQNVAEFGGTWLVVRPSGTLVR